MDEEEHLKGLEQAIMRSMRFALANAERLKFRNEDGTWDYHINLCLSFRTPDDDRYMLGFCNKKMKRATHRFYDEIKRLEIRSAPKPTKNVLLEEKKEEVIEPAKDIYQNRIVIQGEDENTVKVEQEPEKKGDEVDVRDTV
jgi:hypothetical protein